MPKQTAKARGVWVPPVKGIVQPTPETSQITTRPKHRSAVSLGDSDVDEEDLELSESDSEGEFVPEEEDEDESESDDGMEYEEGDINEILNQNYVDGGWEPFSANEWVVDDDSYLSRLYNNEEVFDDAEIGKIRLRPCQLFVDKENFKDALRDYCIQEGFALVVNKVDNLRYTVVCADERCNWRIHAVVLVDGHTWAIKKMEKAQKLLDDIRADPDIKGKTLNGKMGLVGVDGCHLKGNYGCILLSVVSLNGNNEIFPIAVAVADSENKKSHRGIEEGKKGNNRKEKEALLLGKNVVYKAQTRGKKKQADDNLENQPNLIEMMMSWVFDDDVAHQSSNDHGAQQTNSHQGAHQTHTDQAIGVTKGKKRKMIQPNDNDATINSNDSSLIDTMMAQSQPLNHPVTSPTQMRQPSMTQPSTSATGFEFKCQPQG
ncbi:Serine carboxypeptidase-like [Bienertia sinuspersici]